MGSIIRSTFALSGEEKVSSQEIEQRISQTFPYLPSWILEEMTGVQNRYFAYETSYPSKLAVKASEKCIWDAGIEKEEIDLLIFASASQDITEPATANIIQAELGLNCPVFDVKNACNSFMSAIDIADSYLSSGKYKNILICSWETPSKSIRFDVTNREEFKKHFAAYTFWDAGAAMILSHWEGSSGIQHTFFYSDGNSWDTASIMWWGSRYPRDFDTTYFSWEPWKIRDMFISLGSKDFDDGLKKVWWKKWEIKKIFVHQVAVSNFEYMSEILGIDSGVFHTILPEYGNIASCCIPMGLHNYTQQVGELNTWDKIVFLWFASGFSYGFILYEV